MSHLRSNKQKGGSDRKAREASSVDFAELQALDSLTSGLFQGPVLVCPARLSHSLKSSLLLELFC